MGLAKHVAWRGEKRSLCNILVGNLKERYHFEDTGVYGSIILRCILRKRCENADYIHPVQDRNQWRALVNIVMNLRVP
jgi:hypothetical protein